mmetsp:Transcript_7496/g.12661  ORF Transcript_7496/g.12661 Transcript_7496/m.12661 type:complete len:376 (+) Transcript_7496:323-1450(+)
MKGDSEMNEQKAGVIPDIPMPQVVPKGGVRMISYQALQQRQTAAEPDDSFNHNLTYAQSAITASAGSASQVSQPHLGLGVQSQYQMVGGFSKVTSDVRILAPVLLQNKLGNRGSLIPRSINILYILGSNNLGDNCLQHINVNGNFFQKYNVAVRNCVIDFYNLNRCYVPGTGLKPYDPVEAADKARQRAINDDSDYYLMKEVKDLLEQTPTGLIHNEQSFQLDWEKIDGLDQLTQVILSNIEHNKVKQSKGYLQFRHIRDEPKHELGKPRLKGQSGAPLQHSLKNEKHMSMYYMNKKQIQDAIYKKLDLDPNHQIFKGGGLVWGKLRKFKTFEDYLESDLEAICIHKDMTLEWQNLEYAKLISGVCDFEVDPFNP